MTINPDDIPASDETQAVREAATPRPVKRRRWWRWPVRVVVGFGLVSGLVLALLPTLLSTGVGTSWLTQQINSRIPGEVSIGDLKLAWIKGQRLENVKLLDPAGGVVVTLREVSLSDVGLVALLRGSLDLGTVLIDGGVVDLVQDADGSTNLDRALGTSMFAEPLAKPQENQSASTKPHKPKKKSGDEVLPANLSLQFALRDVVVTMVGPGFDAVRVDVPEATLTAHGPAKLGFTLDAAVAQGQDQGSTKWAGTVAGLFDTQGRLDPANAEFDIEGVVDRVPLAALDRVFASGGWLEAVIGPVLDGQLELKGKAADLDALVAVTSQNLNIHQALTADAERLSAAASSLSTLIVTPGSWRFLAKSDAAALVDPFTLVFRLDQLDAPRRGQLLDLSQTRVSAAVRLAEGDAIVLSVPEKGRVVVERLVAQLSSPAADREVAFALSADVDAYGKAGTLSGVVRLSRGETGWDAMKVESLLRSLPMPVVDALLGQGERLTTTFGPTLGLSVLAKADGAGGYQLTADFDQAVASAEPSPLSGTMSGSYDADGTVSLKTDDRLRLLLTPEAFESWLQPVAQAADVQGSAGLSLTQAAEVFADLDLRFALGQGPGLRFDPQRTRAVIGIELPEAYLVDEWYHRTFPVRNGKVVIDAPDLRKPVTAKIEFETDDQAVGRFSADVQITGLMLDDGYLQLQRGQVTSVVELDDVPTAVFDTLTRQKGYAVAAFGQKMSVTVNLDGWSYSALGEGGRVGFELQSENGSLGAFKGVDREGFFHPSGPMTFHLNQTPELAGKVMRWVNPVLLPAVLSANVPMTLTIDNDNFRLPTRDFSIDQLDADIQIQMGTVTISPDVPPVDKIVRALQGLGLIKKQMTYDVKVSPIELKIRNGVIGYEELTFKIDDVQIEFGGTINMVNEIVDMSMTLGGREIDRDPIIKGLVGEGIKIGGTVKKPQVNLASLLGGFTQERLPQTLGDLFGVFLDKELNRGKREPKGDEKPAGGASDGSDSSSDAPKEVSVEEALGGLLGDFLERERRRSEKKRQEKREE